MTGFWDGSGIRWSWAGPYANNLHLAPDRQLHQHLITQFLQAGCSSRRTTNSVKALTALVSKQYTSKKTIHTPTAFWQYMAGYTPPETVQCVTSLTGRAVTTSLIRTFLHSPELSIASSISTHSAYGGTPTPAHSVNAIRTCRKVKGKAYSSAVLRRPAGDRRGRYRFPVSEAADSPQVMLVIDPAAGCD